MKTPKLTAFGKAQMWEVERTLWHGCRYQLSAAKSCEHGLKTVIRETTDQLHSQVNEREHDEDEKDIKKRDQEIGSCRFVLERAEAILEVLSGYFENERRKESELKERQLAVTRKICETPLI